MKFQHFLLTRFNTGLYSSATSEVRADRSGQKPTADPDSWMEHRLGLFEKYTIPSVKAQTCGDFQWLVVFDDGTPERFKERIERYPGPGCPMVSLYTAGAFEAFAERCEPSRVRAKAYISERLHRDTEYLITSRVDNDDAIHSDYIRQVQMCLSTTEPQPQGSLVGRLHGWFPDESRLRAGFISRQILRFVPKQGRLAVNYAWGYALKGEEIALFRNNCNPFISLIERTDLAGGFLTVWATNHKLIGKVADVRDVITDPMWAQVVHERNLLNRFIGDRMPIDDFYAGFGLSRSAKIGS